MSSERSSFESAKDEHSCLEKLPVELVFMIIEHAPECVSGLRLSSSILRSRVNELVLGPSNIQLIDVLRIRRNCDMSFPPQLEYTHCISISIQASKRSLFELLLKTHGAATFAKRVTEEEVMSTPTDYEIQLIIESNYQLMEFIEKCLGKRIGKVSIEFCTNHIELSSISKLLEKKKYAKLRFVSPMLSNHSVNYVVEAVKAQRKIDLALDVDRVSKSDPVKFLIELSRHVDSFHINQMYALGAERRDARYFFGLHDMDWAPIILEMFTKKLSKLYITNYFYRGYLSSKSSETLIAKLSLLGKKICFKTWCWSQNEHNAENNEHYIIVSRDFFTIKHITRALESFDVFHEPTEFSF